jgi:O-antigen/teichoic acid export membrane protein
VTAEASGAREPPQPEDILDSPRAGGAAIRGGAMRSAAYVAGLVLALVSAPLMVRHLGVVEFGRWVLVTTLVALVFGFTEGGLAAVAQREYVTLRGAARDHFMRNVIGLRIALCVGSLLVAVGFATLAGYAEPLIVGTLLAGIGQFALVVQGLVNVSLIGTLRFRQATGSELLRQVLLVLGIVALVVAGARLAPFFAVLVFAYGVPLMVSVVLVRGLMPLRPTYDRGAWRALIRDTVPFAAATAVYAVYFRISVVLMALVTSARETAYYATSYRILEVFIGIPVLLFSAIFPVVARAAEADPARMRYVVQRVFEVALIVGVWFGLSFQLAAPFAIHVLAGDQADPSIGVLRIQGLAVAAAFLSVGFGFPLLALRQNRALLVSNVLALVASVALTLSLAPGFGAPGVAVATGVAELALGICSGFLLVRARGHLHLSLGIVWAVALAAGAGALPMLVPGLHDVLRGVIGSAIYFGILIALRRIPHELRHALFTRIPPGAVTQAQAVSEE